MCTLRRGAAQPCPWHGSQVRRTYGCHCDHQEAAGKQDEPCLRTEHLTKARLRDELLTSTFFLLHAQGTSYTLQLGPQAWNADQSIHDPMWTRLRVVEVWAVSAIGTRFC